MFRHVRTRLLATYLIVILLPLTFLGVHLTREHETFYAQRVSLAVQVQHMRWVIGWAIVVAGLGASVLALLLARSIARPIQEMTAATARLAAGDLSQRVPARTADELGELARGFNAMAAELERMDLLRRAFIADASHELRTPVANLRVAVEALREEMGARDGAGATSPGAGESPALLEAIEHEADRLGRLVEGMLDLSMLESGRGQATMAATAIGDLATRVAASFRPAADRRGITLSTRVPPALPPVLADAERTAQVLANLLDNALKFTPAGGQVTVRVFERHGHVFVEVADEGPGVPPEHLPHIFDRFYKADRARSERPGAGLGLAIARRLMEMQGGLIMADSTPGQGARFTIGLPRERDDARGADRASTA
ncbi:MAG: HAMP domain-containing histidine kinase [Armatimonadetes bacterium]|nr:HAMP domain-containing histidine kinase [Armatimonadota bacterium]